MSWLYAVSGKKTFPLDMLRHDRCFPADEHTVHSLFLALTVTQVDRKLMLVGELPPNEGRWKSFGWEVSDARHVNVGRKRRRPVPAR